MMVWQCENNVNGYECHLKDAMGVKHADTSNIDFDKWNLDLFEKGIFLFSTWIEVLIWNIE